MDKKEIIKLRRGDKIINEAKHFHPAYLARKKIEDYNEQKQLEREFSYEY